MANDVYVKLLTLNTALIIAFFVISTALQIFVFLYKLQIIRKLYHELKHTKERKTQAVLLLRHRRQEQLEESKRIGGH